jgi:hypothetical protein
LVLYLSMLSRSASLSSSAASVQVTCTWWGRVVSASTYLE